ncbi:MFS transporter [Myxococcus faecalis]|uniref:spinster family MFS transporter n=1 Tax=Myxococcus faecalis TaxID=3115646 RepID=UPI003CF68247
MSAPSVSVSPPPSPSPSPTSTPVAPATNAGYALLILTLINLVNYLDRYIVAVALPGIQQEFGINDTQSGLLGTMFIVVFMLASPLGGFLGDRYPRKFLVAGGVLLWSLATGASGLATSFIALLVARAVIGIGEAGYGAVAPSIISDLYPRDRRTRMLALFYIAIPVGAAAGYGLGGWLTQKYSWHVAFFAGGVPGLILGAMAFFMPEPQRGAMDGPDAQVKLPFMVGLRGLGRNAAFWAVTAGYTLMTFSIGGLGFWMPTYLVRERAMSADSSGFLFGAITAVAGLLGTVAGGWLGDKLDRKREGGGLWMSGIGLLLAAPCMYLAVHLKDVGPTFAAIGAAQFLIFLNSGPINAAIVNCVPPAFRAFAMGLNVLCIHLLGDAISPTLIGNIADASNLRTAIAVNALPVLLGGLALLVGARLFRDAVPRERATA